MSDVILTIADVFQIDGRGTAVTGYRGAAWSKAARGALIELQAPSKQPVRTHIRDLEEFHPCFTSDSRLHGGILLGDQVAAEDAPPGTQIVEATK